MRVADYPASFSYRAGFTPWISKAMMPAAAPSADRQSA